MKGKILKTPSPLPSPAGWRGEKEDEKILTMCPHPDPLPGSGEGTCKGRERMKGKILKTPSP
jgi:hypothetical protein